MGISTDYDLGGMDVIVHTIKTGATGPGSASTTNRNVAAGSTLTLTAATHAGRTILLDTLTGSVVTLPASAGNGNVYKFYVSVAPTSNAHIVKVANATDVMTGWVSTATTTEASSEEEAFAATEDTITMNGTTTGGIVGSYIECTDVVSGFWLTEGRLVGSGTLTTPLSATVS